MVHVRMQLCSAAGSACLTPHAPIDSAQLPLALEKMSGLQDCRISFSLIPLLLVSPRFSDRYFYVAWQKLAFSTVVKPFFTGRH